MKYARISNKSVIFVVQNKKEMEMNSNTNGTLAEQIKESLKIWRNTEKVNNKVAKLMNK